MGWCHDFIHGSYYEDGRGERVSPTEYYRREREAERLRQGQHYILIRICEGKVKGKETYCDLHIWHYYADKEEPDPNVVILSANEYIKNEKKCSYYRKYKGDSYLSLEVEANVKLKVDKVEEVFGFFLCTVKGKGTLYTKEAFQKKFLP